MEQVAFARFDRHRCSTVDIPIESGECAGRLRVRHTLCRHGLLQLIACGQSLVDFLVQCVEIGVNL